MSEVNITVPVPQGTKSMFVVCEIEKNHLKVAIKGQTPIIDVSGNIEMALPHLYVDKHAQYLHNKNLPHREYVF